MASTVRKLMRLVAADWAQEYDAQAPGNSDSPAGASGALAGTAGATLLSVTATNKSASTLYLMFFDSLTVPNNGAVPIFMPIALKQDTPLNWRLNDVPGGASLFGHTFTNGITWVASTTADTLTADVTSSVWVNLRFQN